MCYKIDRLAWNWIRRIMLTIQDTPTWPKFKEAFGRGLLKPCGECENHWSAAFVEHILEWEIELHQEDSKLPNWPF
jgi:hypothetical protein